MSEPKPIHEMTNEEIRQELIQLRQRPKQDNPLKPRKPERVVRVTFEISIPAWQGYRSQWADELNNDPYIYHWDWEEVPYAGSR